MKTMMILLSLVMVSCASVVHKGHFEIAGKPLELVTEYDVEYGSRNVVIDDGSIYLHFFDADTSNQLLYTPTWKRENGALYIGIQYFSQWREAYALRNIVRFGGPMALNEATRVIWWPADELAKEIKGNPKDAAPWRIWTGKRWLWM